LSTKFNLNYDDIIELERKLGRLPRKMERVMSESLHSDGIEIATEEITKQIPISAPRKRREPKIHAKLTKWSKSEEHNLGFTIKSKGGAANKPGSFGYLVFPNEGRGSSNPLEQRFMEKGLENAKPKILHRLSKRIEKALEEEL
jgi:hypothetical protein